MREAGEEEQEALSMNAILTFTRRVFFFLLFQISKRKIWKLNEVWKQIIVFSLSLVNQFELLGAFNFKGTEMKPVKMRRNLK